MRQRDVNRRRRHLPQILVEHFGHVQKEPIVLSKRVPGKTFTPELDAVIAKALAKNRDDRYQTASDFAAALSAAMRAISPPAWSSN